MGNTSIKDNSKITKETYKNFMPILYEGTWYEIGKKPLFWEKDCYSARAIYKWDHLNQKILVENQCFDKYGEKKRSRYGEARIPDMRDASKLLLKFTDGLPAYPGESPYWVFDTDYYTYSIVGEPSGRYLWLLSRTPTMKASQVGPLLDKIKSFGYNPDELLGNKESIVV